MTVTLLEGHVVDVLASQPAGHFHTVVTSPPYLFLRAYGTVPQTWPDGWVGELGQEDSPERYVEHLVAVFRSVRRVLRPDGCLWVNLAGCYYNDPGGQNGAPRMPPLGAGSVLHAKAHDTFRGISNKAVDANRALGRQKRGRHAWLKPLDWVDVPGLFARAMQQDGWTWRSDVVWVKPSALPESVAGTRWERCRVKVAGKRKQPPGAYKSEAFSTPHGATVYVPGANGSQWDSGAEWADCPGCQKCAATEGLVLRRGSGRPTKTHEHIHLYTRGPGYFYDAEGVREGNSEGAVARFGKNPSVVNAEKYGGMAGESRSGMVTPEWRGNGRNLRDVWTISPEPLSDAHYAAYPSALPERCIKAGTSEWGCCPTCGAPWARVVSRSVHFEGGSGRAGNTPDGKWAGTEQAVSGDYDIRMGPVVESSTLGWRPTCRCPGVAEQAPVPARVLDPFGGSGTTALAANRLGRDCTLVELKPQYATLARKRLGREPLSLFAWQGQESMAPAGEEAPPLETTKQEQHPTRTVGRFPPLVEAPDGAGGLENTPEEVGV